MTEPSVNKLCWNLINDKARESKDFTSEFNRRHNIQDRDTHRNLIDNIYLETTAKKYA